MKQPTYKQLHNLFLTAFAYQYIINKQVNASIMAFLYSDDALTFAFQTDKVTLLASTNTYNFNRVDPFAGAVHVKPTYQSSNIQTPLTRLSHPLFNGVSSSSDELTKLTTQVK